MTRRIAIARYVPTSIAAVAALAVSAVLLFPGCSQRPPEEIAGPPDFAPPASLEVDEAQPRTLMSIATLPADVSRILPAGETAPAFAVACRTTEIALFDCRQCHDRPVTPADPAAETQTRRSHVDITLNHGAAANLQCATCHDHRDMGQLLLLDRSTVSFDQAYTLCAQCHFEQARDWVGGAHGKRLGGWRGDRVVLSCTGCHDPHSPLFPHMMPVAQPTISPEAH